MTVDSTRTFGFIPQRVFPQTKHFVFFVLGLLVAGVIVTEGEELIVGIVGAIIVVCPVNTSKHSGAHSGADSQQQQHQMGNEQM
jgi:mannose/fructose/N-acetylgalactosamine-specific phosphotransferase system component IIC